MENNENQSFKGGNALKESHGTGVLSTMVFMAVVIGIMALLKTFIG